MAAPDPLFPFDPSQASLPAQMAAALALGTMADRLTPLDGQATGGGFAPGPKPQEWAYAELVGELTVPSGDPYTPRRYVWRELSPTDYGTLAPFGPARGTATGDFVVFANGGPDLANYTGSGSGESTGIQCLLWSTASGYWVAVNASGVAVDAYGSGSGEAVRVRAVIGLRAPTIRLSVWIDNTDTIVEPGTGGATPVYIYPLTKTIRLDGAYLVLHPDQVMEDTQPCRYTGACCTTGSGTDLASVMCCPEGVPTRLILTLSAPAIPALDGYEIFLDFTASGYWTSAIVVLPGGGGRHYFELRCMSQYEWWALYISNFDAPLGCYFGASGMPANGLTTHTGTCSPMNLTFSPALTYGAEGNLCDSEDSGLVTFTVTAP